MILCFFNANVAAATLESMAKDCLASLPSKPQSSVSLQTHCPTFYARLKQLELLPVVTEQSPFLQQYYIEYLANLLQSSERQRILNFAELDHLLHEIMIPEPQDQTDDFFNAFLEWLKSFHSEEHEQKFKRLLDFFESLSLSYHAMTIVVYALLFLTVLAGVSLIVYECYKAGLFNASKRQLAKESFTAMQKQRQQQLTISDIQRLGPDAQVVALLNHVIAVLIARRLLPNDSSLSNQELLQCLQQPLNSEFSALVVAADFVLFAGSEPTPDQLQHCWRSAEGMIAQ